MKRVSSPLFVVVIGLVVEFLVLSCPAAQGDELDLHARTRVKAAGSDGWHIVDKQLAWDGQKTAVIICDMWDTHHCQGAARRVAEMAPRMNEVVAAARRQGALVIHCPSGCLDAYKDTPQRKLAQQAPKVVTKVPLMTRCALDPAKEPPLPIDDSDGGCDCQPPCPKGHPWRKQIDAIKIEPGDAITDNLEAFYLLEQRGIENVIVMGVHTNMCVLHRPFSIRQLVGQGKNVVLMRDMTDSMYNSRMKPNVSHFRGTELVVEHIEKYGCPTITSSDFLSRPAFRFAEDKRPHVALVYNDNHYRPQDTLPDFAQDLQDRYGYYVTLMRAQKGRGIPGLDALSSADLMLLFVRREPLPVKQLSAIKNFLAAGKPVVAVRTASHAFSLSKGTAPEGLAQWTTFDADVLGGNYHGHYESKLGTQVHAVTTSQPHPIMAGVDLDGWQATGELYQVSPIAKDATVLLTGTVPDQPAEPLAWVRQVNRSRIFYTSLGHPDHFRDPRFRKLLANAVHWELSEPTKPMFDYIKKKANESGEPLSPEESLKLLRTPADLTAVPVLTEPVVAQPVFLNFDERGRMWVVQYLQYPFPAGLKILSEDKFLRATYDKVPPAPPHHFPGLDKITIHEDTDGDGRYDKHKTFVEGLNIASAATKGRGGVWVLNPPYLLFYPDKNNDDVPDGDPVVHLSGFGLEDTHSVVNSLQWGPDGWLYAAQGSTVSGAVVRPGVDKKPVNSLGQVIWRYHPELRKYEIFAEGGGNAFGVEIDSKGRIFSGHNGGDTRGFHYVQGGYYQKGFAKHGPLSNPYTFGYFPAMTHAKVPRFTHCFIIYEGGALPGPYDGKLFGVHPLLSHVVSSQVDPEGSSFKTKDVGFAIESNDQWFRPVDIKSGPDGGVYVADMYEGQIAHLLHHEGKIDRSNGRIYRLTAKGAKPLAPFDLSKKSSAELIELLASPNKWFRRTAIRVLGDRKDASIVPALAKKLHDEQGQTALEALWALNASGGFNDAVAVESLDHANPYVRLWAVRLLGDSGQVSPAVAKKLADLATNEKNVEVRSQLACTARRLPAAECLPVVRQLLTHDEDSDDIHMPLLLWWAIESKVESDRAAVVALFEDSSFWRLPLVQKQILHRVMRRYAAGGTRKDLLTCAKLLQLSPGDEWSKQLMRGFEEAYQGRSMTNMPGELVDAMARLGGGSVSLGLRQGRADAIDKALAIIADDKADAGERLQLVQVFGEVKQPRCIPGLLNLVASAKDDGLRMAALTALQPYDDQQIGRVTIQAYGNMTDDVRSVAQTLLVSRKSWARELIGSVEEGRIEPRSVPLDVVRKLTVYRDAPIAAAITKYWGKIDGATTAQMRERIDKLQDVLQAGAGTPYAGKKLFQASCAKCHKLFGDGGQIGPDLTAFKRDDLANMLTNIVNPSAEIREGFETYQAVTDDGRVVTGFLVDRDPQVVVLRGADGQNISLPQGEIEELVVQRKSLMPEGQLETLSEQQIRDLFAYLRSTQPLSN
jgi:putative heme-binding domain-containing protein